MLNQISRHSPHPASRTGRFNRRFPAALAGAFIGAALLLTPAGVAAQSVATPSELSTRTEIVDFLGQTYDEAPVAGGIASNGSVLEVFTSPDGNSWTIILTSPDGTSRVVAAGETWLELLKLKGEPI